MQIAYFGRPKPHAQHLFLEFFSQSSISASHTVSCHLDRGQPALDSCNQCNHRMSQEMKLARLVGRARRTGVAMYLLHPCRKDRQQNRSASHSNESTLVFKARARITLRRERVLHCKHQSACSTVAPMRFLLVSNLSREVVDQLRCDHRRLATRKSAITLRLT
jgi:hypothetical protein